MSSRMTAIAGALLLLAAEAATAATNSVQMQVSVQVVPKCKIFVTDLAFGQYDPLVDNATKPLDGSANLQVTCTKSLRANVLMEEPPNGLRAMRSGNDTLPYALFSDSVRMKPWGTGVNGVQVTGTGKTPQELTVFGRVPPGEVVPAGWYSDSVTATVDF